MIIVVLLLLIALKLDCQELYLDYLIGFVLLISLASFLVFFYIRQNLILRIEPEEKWLKEGDSVGLKLSVVLPAFHTNIRSVVELKYLQTGLKESRSLLCEESGTVFRFDDLKPGTVRLEIKKVSVSGLLGLVRLPRKIEYSREFNVYPKKAPVNFSMVRKNYIRGEGEILNAKGDDYNEIYEVRPLQEGDDLKHVHRALSAKYDEYIVKVGSDSRKSYYTYYLSEEEDFTVMLNLLGQLTELRETAVKEEGALMTAIYKGVEKELTYESQLYDLIDEVYADYVPKSPKEKRKAAKS